MTIPQIETYLESTLDELMQELTDTQKKLAAVNAAQIREALHEIVPPIVEQAIVKRENTWRKKLQNMLKWIASQV